MFSFSRVTTNADGKYWSVREHQLYITFHLPTLSQCVMGDNKSPKQGLAIMNQHPDSPSKWQNPYWVHCIRNPEWVPTQLEETGTAGESSRSPGMTEKGLPSLNRDLNLTKNQVRTLKHSFKVVRASQNVLSSQKVLHAGKMNINSACYVSVIFVFGYDEASVLWLRSCDWAAFQVSARGFNLINV